MKLHWRCVDFGSLSNLEKNRKNNKKKLVPSISLSHSCVCREWMSSTTYDDARQSSDLWLSGKKLSQKPTGGRKKKKKMEGKGVLILHTSSFHPRFLPDVRVYLIFSYTFCLELWQVANDVKERKKAENLFFFFIILSCSSFFTSSIALVSGIYCDYLSLLCSSFLLLPG